MDGDGLALMELMADLKGQWDAMTQSHGHPLLAMRDALQSRDAKIAFAKRIHAEMAKVHPRFAETTMQHVSKVSARERACVYVCVSVSASVRSGLRVFVCMCVRVSTCVCVGVHVRVRAFASAGGIWHGVGDHTLTVRGGCPPRGCRLRGRSTHFDARLYKCGVLEEGTQLGAALGRCRAVLGDQPWS